MLKSSPRKIPKLEATLGWGFESRYVVPMLEWSTRKTPYNKKDMEHEGNRFHKKYAQLPSGNLSNCYAVKRRQINLGSYYHNFK